MTIAAGWYADPVQPGSVRWWNGTSWTDAVQHAVPAHAGIGGVAGTTATPQAYGTQAYGTQAYGTQAYGTQAYGTHQPVYDLAARQEFAPIHLLLPQAQSAATRSLVWGIVGVILFVAFPAAIVAIAFGAIGLARASRLRTLGEAPTGRGRAIAGIVLGSISLVLFVALLAMIALTP